METKDNDFAIMTIRIPEETYKTFVAYKSRFKQHMSLNALVVEAIIDQVARQQPQPAPEARP